MTEPVKLTIYKCPFRIAGEVELIIQGLIRILHIGMQEPGRGSLCAWCLVNTASWAEEVSIKLTVKGTGHPIGEQELLDKFHVTTVLDGDYVWHIFAPRENWVFAEKAR